MATNSPSPSPSAGGEGQIPAPPGERLIPFQKKEKRRLIVIAADISAESVFIVRWAVQNYLLSDDRVILFVVHNLPVDAAVPINNLKQPLVEKRIPFELWVTNIIDIEQRLPLLARIPVSALIRGSRGFGGEPAVMEMVISYCMRSHVFPVVLVHRDGTAVTRRPAGARGEETMLHPPSTTKSTSTISSYFIKRQERNMSYIIDTRLETWDDPTPRETGCNLEDLREACIAAGKRQFNSKAKYPTREDRIKHRAH